MGHMTGLPVGKQTRADKLRSKASVCVEDADDTNRTAAWPLWSKWSDADRPRCRIRRAGTMSCVYGARGVVSKDVYVCYCLNCDRVTHCRTCTTPGLRP